MEAVIGIVVMPVVEIMVEMEMGVVVVEELLELLLVIVEVEVKVVLLEMVTVKMKLLVRVEKVEVEKQYINVYRKQGSWNTFVTFYPKKWKMKDR